MFRNFFLLIITSLIIVSCGDEPGSVSVWWLVMVENEDIKIEVPANWKVIDDKEKILPVAKDSDIELAVVSENMVWGFANNLLILSNELNSFTTSKDFSMFNNIWAQSDYLDYKKIESKEFSFLDEELSVLYIFEAKYNLDTPKLKFLQTAHICNQDKAFFLTLAIPTSVRDISKYEYLLSTFACK